MFYYWQPERVKTLAATRLLSDRETNKIRIAHRRRYVLCNDSELKKKKYLDVLNYSKNSLMRWIYARALRTKQNVYTSAINQDTRASWRYINVPTTKHVDLVQIFPV